MAVTKKNVSLSLIFFYCFLKNVFLIFCVVSLSVKAIHKSLIHRVIFTPIVAGKVLDYFDYSSFTTLFSVDKSFTSNASCICKEPTKFILESQRDAASWLACPFEFTNLNTLFMLDNPKDKQYVIPYKKAPKLVCLVVENGEYIELEEKVAENITYLSSGSVCLSSGIMKFPLPKLETVQISTPQDEPDPFSMMAMFNFMIPSPNQKIESYDFSQSNLKYLSFHGTVSTSLIVHEAHQLEVLAVNSTQKVQLYHPQKLSVLLLKNVHVVQLENTTSLPQLCQLEITNSDDSFLSRLDQLSSLQALKLSVHEPSLTTLLPPQSTIQVLDISNAIGSYILPNLHNLKILKLHSHGLAFIECSTEHFLFPSLQHLEFKSESAEIFDFFFSRINSETAPLLESIVLRCSARQIDLSVFKNLNQVVIRPKYERARGEGEETSIPPFHIMCSPNAPIKMLMVENYFNEEYALDLFSVMNGEHCARICHDIRLEDPNINSKRHFQELSLHNMPHLAHFECADRFLKHDLLLENVCSEAIEATRLRHEQFQQK